MTNWEASAVVISREAVLAWIQAFAAAIDRHKEYLTQLDAAIGDADHGVNMHRGLQAVLDRLKGVADRDIGTILRTVGMTLVSSVGGASGPLYGTFFLRASQAAGTKMELTADDWLQLLQEGVQGVIDRGKAQRGEKTMLDALGPGLDALRACLSDHRSLAEALQASAKAAQQGMEATIPMLATKGRASYLGERSVGHQDPGATSAYLLLQTAAETWGGGIRLAEDPSGTE